MARLPNGVSVSINPTQQEQEQDYPETEEVMLPGITPAQVARNIAKQFVFPSRKNGKSAMCEPGIDFGPSGVEFHNCIVTGEIREEHATPWTLGPHFTPSPYEAERRRVGVRVSLQAVACMFKNKGGRLRVNSTIPRDAKVVNVFQESLADAFVFVYEHPSFKVVPEGEKTPMVDIETIFTPEKTWTSGEETRISESSPCEQDGGVLVPGDIAKEIIKRFGGPDAY